MNSINISYVATISERRKYKEKIYILRFLLLAQIQYSIVHHSWYLTYSSYYTRKKHSHVNLSRPIFS